MSKAPNTLAADIFGLPQKAHDLRDRVRAFMDREVLPRENSVASRDVEGLDRLTLALRAEAGRLGITFPEIMADWQSSGFGWRIRQLFFEEAGRSGLGPGALHCAPPDAPNVDLLLAVATPDQRVRFLEPLLASSCRSCFAMTEPAPGAGSDPSMLQTQARQDGRRWVLNGTKWFISGAIGASFAIVVAATQSGPTLFLVGCDNPGWQVLQSIDTLAGYQLGGHGRIEIRDCVVDDDDRLGEVGRGLAYAQMRLEPARLAHCMRMIGGAERVLDIVKAYVRERNSFGRNLSDLQSVQNLIADALIDLHLSRLVTWQVAARIDAGLPVTQESAMAKVFVSEAVGRIADAAVQLTGAQGVDLSGPVAEFYQHVRPFRIYDGASEVHRGAIGRRFLKSHDGSARQRDVAAPVRA